jgi:hypothetical protein
VEVTEHDDVMLEVRTLDNCVLRNVTFEHSASGEAALQINWYPEPYQPCRNYLIEGHGVPPQLHQRRAHRPRPRFHPAAGATSATTARTALTSFWPKVAWRT